MRFTRLKAASMEAGLSLIVYGRKSCVLASLTLESSLSVVKRVALSRLVTARA